MAEGGDSLEYTPEPDMFHDVFGEVPMHAHPVFADFLAHYGTVRARLQSAEALERLGRLFWYTVEFVLIRQDGRTKFYGSGVISSHGDSTFWRHLCRWTGFTTCCLPSRASIGSASP